MQRKENPARLRLSRLNKYILIVALLWIALTVVLLVEASPSHAQPANPPRWSANPVHAVPS